ncbi:hypothetical protein BB558_005813 [Smittium angustum]|uniref:Uncharacterized protein n=1 Tax=Smittium angustum TaxID=133377 RepID=A0A2U1IZH1_SMIAN|nr:hypothetical protein BB558_005981 [Smittium angustum]PVZ98173.1 hypothetical protein BB558_005813 [Smittium angustum]
MNKKKPSSLAELRKLQKSKNKQVQPEQKTLSLKDAFSQIPNTRKLNGQVVDKNSALKNIKDQKPKLEIGSRFNSYTNPFLKSFENDSLPESPFEIISKLEISDSQTTLAHIDLPVKIDGLQNFVPYESTKETNNDENEYSLIDTTNYYNSSNEESGAEEELYDPSMFKYTFESKRTIVGQNQNSKRKRNFDDEKSNPYSKGKTIKTNPETFKINDKTNNDVLDITGNELVPSETLVNTINQNDNIPSFSMIKSIKFVFAECNSILESLSDNETKLKVCSALGGMDTNGIAREFYDSLVMYEHYLVPQGPTDSLSDKKTSFEKYKNAFESLLKLQRINPVKYKYFYMFSKLIKVCFVMNNTGTTKNKQTNEPAFEDQQIDEHMNDFQQVGYISQPTRGLKSSLKKGGIEFDVSESLKDVNSRNIEGSKESVLKVVGEKNINSLKDFILKFVESQRNDIHYLFAPSLFVNSGLIMADSKLSKVFTQNSDPILEKSSLESIKQKWILEIDGLLFTENYFKISNSLQKLNIVEIDTNKQSTDEQPIPNQKDNKTPKTPPKDNPENQKDLTEKEKDIGINKDPKIDVPDTNIADDNNKNEKQQDAQRPEPKPDVQKPEPKPDVQKPEPKPEKEKPDVTAPEKEKPDVTTPEKENPQEKVPEKEKPEEKVPEKENPEEKVPEKAPEKESSEENDNEKVPEGEKNEGIKNEKAQSSNCKSNGICIKCNLISEGKKEYCKQENGFYKMEYIYHATTLANSVNRSSSNSNLYS